MNKKTLILYTTHEINENLIFFCQNGYIDDENYYFIFIFNCLNLKIQFLPQQKNVKIINRNNTGLDFGAWTDTLFSKEDNIFIFEKYDYFIFINSTVRGPFLPIWHNSENNKWPELFINKLNDKVKLVGTTINPCEYGTIHQVNGFVQSMFLVTDKIGLNIAMQNKIFDKNNTSMTKLELVFNNEPKFSQAILDSGYNISSMLYAYKDCDFRNIKLKNDDHCHNNKYFDININPYEVIFIKTNRNIDYQVLEKYTKWHQNFSCKNLIKKILYGISVEESINVTDKIVEFLNQNCILDLNTDINKLIGHDPYRNRSKKLFFFCNNIENPEIIIDEINNNLSTNLILLTNSN